MNYWILLTPVIAAIIGWFLHSIAIRYILRNVLPKKKNQIAAKIGQVAAHEFASYKGLEEKINDPRTLDSVLPVIEAHIDAFLNEKLKKEMPVISMFIGQKTTDKLKEVFMNEIQNLFPQIIGQFATNLKTSIDIEGIIRKRLDSISPEALEQMVTDNLGAELRGLRLLGAFTGFVAGLILVIITLLAG